MMFVRVLLCALCLAATPPLAAEVYTWVDEAGVRHFSDHPVPGAKRIRVVPRNVYSAPAAARGAGAAAPASSAGEPPGLPVRYESVQITFPEDGSTIRENSGRVEVQVRVRPALRTQRGHTVVVVLDEAVETAASEGRAVFENVPRGTHRLVARVLDAEGNVLLESTPVTFHLHRYSALLDAPEGNEADDGAGPLRRAPMAPRAPLAPRAPRYPATR